MGDAANRAHTETIVVRVTPAQKRRFESCGGDKYIRAVLNGAAFLDSKRMARENQK